MSADEFAYLAITRLQAAYADVITRRAWGELAPLFEPAAPIRIDTVDRPAVELTGPGELEQFLRTAMARFEFLEFVILNTVITVDSDDAAHGRLYIAEERQERGDHGWSTAFGRYDDTYARSDDRWRFAARSYRSLARRAGTERATVLPPPDEA